MKKTFFGVAFMLMSLSGCVQDDSKWASSCAAGLKLVAGACVRSCPGGYEDRGSVCVGVRQR